MYKNSFIIREYESEKEGEWIRWKNVKSHYLHNSSLLNQNIAFFSDCLGWDSSTYDEVFSSFEWTFEWHHSLRCNNIKCVYARSLTKSNFIDVLRFKRTDVTSFTIIPSEDFLLNLMIIILKIHQMKIFHWSSAIFLIDEQQRVMKQNYCSIDCRFICAS